MEYLTGALVIVIFIIAYGYFDYFVTQKPARDMIIKASDDFINNKISAKEYKSIEKQFYIKKFGN